MSAVANHGPLFADIDHMAGVGWVVMTLMWISLIVVIGAFVWFATRGNAASGRSSGKASALAILAERYARGEIDDEEYRRRADHLKNEA